MRPSKPSLFATTNNLPSLYVVTDRRRTGADGLLRVLKDIIPEQGLMIHIREKDLGTRDLLGLVDAVHRLARPFRVPCLINDRVDLVLATQAAGVHLRSDSMPVAEARNCLGPGYLVGKSVHSVQEAVESEKDGADFVVLGPVYATPSKREYGAPLGLGALRDASRQCRIPLYAIGGITPSRVAPVMEAGACGVAAISSIIHASSPREAVKQYATQLRLCGATSRRLRDIDPFRNPVLDFLRVATRRVRAALRRGFRAGKGMKGGTHR